MNENVIKEEEEEEEVVKESVTGEQKGRPGDEPD